MIRALAVVLLCAAPLYAQTFIAESARQIPIAAEVDVVVVGGSAGGCAAAIATAQKGAKVFLLSPKPYLGQDVAGTLRLWLEEGETPASPLGQALFAANPAKPLAIKSALDEALLKANVQFVVSSYFTDVLRDDKGNVAGITMVNRAGRQAVIAKVVIDATDRGIVAMAAGAKAEPYGTRMATFTRVVLGPEVRKGPGVKSRTIPGVFKSTVAGSRGKPANQVLAQVVEYTLDIEMRGGSYADFAEAEQRARDMTYEKDELMAAEDLFQVPPDPIKSRKSVAGEWPGSEKLDLDALRPDGIERVYVVGGRADLSREAAAKLLRPLNLIDVGTRVGISAAAEAKPLPAPKGAHLAAIRNPQSETRNGETREPLNPLRPWQKAPTISAEARNLPVLGSYDVVVIGGGTSGAPAAISAARAGAKTLCVEYLAGLGGVGTLGEITKYYAGYRKGFTAEVMNGMASWNIEEKMEWWRTALRKEGGQLWFNVLGCGAIVTKVDGMDKVVGVIVATPLGRGAILAKAVIDSTGSADIAAAAGAPTMWTDDSDIAVQGTGLPPRDLGKAYTNTDFTFTDETDLVDVTNLFVSARKKYRGSFDVAPLIDTRERRRIVGDYTLTVLDIVNHRKFPDTVNLSSSNFDSHGYSVDPLFTLKPPGHGGLLAETPYRCLLPKGLEGVLVTGLATSAHRDAVPIIRMQPCLQNQGYAAGLAASMAAKEDKPLRAIDIKALQKKLVEIGNLPATVVGQKDSFPLPKKDLELAVESVKLNWEGLEAILASPADAMPLLKQGYAANDGDAKLVYAQILAMLGDATGIEPLVKHVETSQWDKGWNFRGMGQYGASMSRVDAAIQALGYAKDKRALPAIITKITQLDSDASFSHHRAVARACELIGDSSAAGPLAELLKKPGMQTADTAAAVDRSHLLRELTLARALYKCGDKDNLGKKILDKYATDPRGVYARHAAAVLNAR